MFMRFFTELREAKVPVTLKEYLMLMCNFVVWWLVFDSLC